MFRDVTTVALAFALGAGFAAAQTAPAKPVVQPVPPAVVATVPAPQPVPSPVPVAQAVDDYARNLALVAAGTGPIALPIEALSLRAYEEALMAQSTGQATARPVQRQVDEAKVQFAFAQAGASYDRGISLLDRGRYDEAIAAFDGVIKAGSPKVEGAYYWKAYAQNRLGQRSEALATLDAMLKAYPNGRWAGDARALQVEVKQAAGQPVNPDQATDDEIKLIALNSIVRSQPEQAVAIIEKMLAGSASPRVKERALLVLSQAPTPRAKTMLIEIAKGKGNPDLQMKAIDYFGNFASADPTTIKQLVEIYRTVADVEVKKRVIRSLAAQGRFSTATPFFVGSVRNLAVTGVAPNVYVVPDPAAATVEATRRAAEAVARGAQLGVASAEMEARRKALTDERAKAREALAAEARAALWQIYQSESSIELKREILRTSFLVGEPAKLIEIVRTEKDPELRRAGVRSLGMVREQKATDTLLAIYREDKDPEVCRSVIDALVIQQNAVVLVQLARQETDPGMKRTLVERLSTMKNKEATDYMMEILRK